MQNQIKFQNLSVCLKNRKSSFKRRSKFSDCNPCQNLLRFFIKCTPFYPTPSLFEKLMQPFKNGNVFPLIAWNSGKKSLRKKLYRAYFQKNIDNIQPKFSVSVVD